uniref:DUF155 domain-containing protein n=1 Tax=Dracunculus medinensis TaxID=318479 RepID=A0A0N4UKE4_DRAME
LLKLHFQSFIGPQVVSIASGDSFDLLSALKDPQIQLIYQHKNIDNDAEAGLHFSLKPEYLVKSNKIREFFLFNDGVVVFWGLDQRSQILRLLRKYINNPYDSKLVEEEIESMSFLITNEDETCIKNDRFLINIQKHETEFNSSKSILERYAFSHGMATSVKIAIWESQLSERAEILAITTKALSEGYIPWKRKEVLKLIGYFSDLRHSINLNCDLLSTDFYWENEHLENFYDQAIKHFMVRKRMRLLNNRLDYCEDLVKLIDGMLAHRHASTLEWMIIILIVIEVIFDILHFFENSFYEKLLKRIDSSDRYDK